MKVLKEHLMLMMVLLVGFVGFAQAQYSRVTGTVTDDKRTPLPGVSVVIKGTTKGVATDFDGKYTLTDVARGAVLEFSSVGYKTLNLKVTGEQLNVKLSEVAQDLDEVVVVGYGTQKRGDVTTAITSVKTQDLDQRPVISAAQAIQGRAAGIQVVQPNGAPGAGLAVRILGDITREKVRILQDADDIYIENMQHYVCEDGEVLYDKVWQAGTVLLSTIRSVGVMGDERTYEHPVALRAVTSTDAMSADWAQLPYDFMAKVSNEIINKVKGVNRVCYDISSKPPATIEWE